MFGVGLSSSKLNLAATNGDTVLPAIVVIPSGAGETERGRDDGIEESAEREERRPDCSKINDMGTPAAGEGERVVGPGDALADGGGVANRNDIGDTDREAITDGVVERLLCDDDKCC